MILDYSQISTTIAVLHKAYDEQEWILNDTYNVICARLSAAWECEAQKAYEDAFIEIREKLLSHIIALIQLFEMALAESQNGIFLVNIDLQSFNVTR